MTVNMLRHSEPKGEESLTITSDKNTFIKECRLHLTPTKDTSSNPQNGVFMNARASNYSKNFHLLRHQNSLQQ
jgi:hypothetical protein